MKRKILTVSVIIVFFLSLAACVTQQDIIPGGLIVNSSKYNPSSYVLHPKFKVFHENETSSKLYIKLYTNELRFSSANKERINKALIRVEYKIKESLSSNDIIDSSRTRISIKKAEGQTSIVSFFKIKDISIDQYYIEIFVIDVYSNKKSISYIKVNKTDDDNYQYYFTVFEENLKPEFDEYFTKRDTFLIKHYKNDLKKMHVSYFNTDFKPAERPNIEYEENLNLSKDTGWYLEKIEDKFLFSGNKPGIYILRADSSKIKGIMKVLFKDDYPLVSRSYQLTESLYYLLSKEEYSKLINTDNLKLSADNFWLNTTKNKERASEILKIWYTRASYSNYYFTSYKEGWKTDRGMIYMVFGPPDNMKTSDEGEIWTYTNSKEEKTLKFSFIRNHNSFSDNSYILVRNPNYVSDWSKAVKSWKSGVIYNF